MNSFDNIQALANRLKELSFLLSSSKINETELQEFEDIARTLYERGLILNYKAKEEKVYQKKSASIEIEKEKKIEEKQTEETVLNDKKEETDMPSSTAAIEFDFTSDFTSTTPAEPLKEPEEVAQKEVSREEEVNQVNSEEVNANIEVEETATQIDGSKFDLFYSHFNKAYKEANNDKLSNAKIKSLIGAFGLNDKLLFTKELFNNDTGEFNQAIELLDSYENPEIALKRLSEIAIKKNWNKDEDAVNDFAHIINRRYVQ